MNIDKFKYFSLDAVKSLKRNSTTTIFSVTTISATFFINGLFLLFLLSIGRSFESIYTNNQAMKEMIMILICFKFAIFIVIPLVSVLLIVNAIKMVLFSRRSEISIMKLIGATNWFIRWPFIIEGAIIGIAGAFAGYLSLFLIYSFIYTKAMEYSPEFNLLQPQFITNIMLFPFEMSGIFIGFIGSIIALRKFLNV